MSKKDISKSGIKNKNTNQSNEDNTTIGIEKKQFIGLFIIFCISSLLYYVSIHVLQSLYKPDISKAIAFAQSILCIDGYNPEPQEKAIYILGILIFTFSYFVLLILFNKIRNKIKEKMINPLFYSCITICLIVIAFFTYKGFTAQNPCFEHFQNPHDTNKSNWDFYFISTFLYSNLSLFSFIIFPIIAFAIVKTTFQKTKNVGLTMFRDFSIYTFCICIIIIIFCITAFSFPNTYENKYDFTAVYYSVVQVYHGIPMLVNDFTNTYGLYPHFVTPILKVFGLSILSFTCIMATLLSLCFVLLLLIFKKHIDNKWLVLFGFTSIFFNSYMYFRIVTPYDNVFSMSPIRWILMFSLFFFVSYYITRKTKLLYYLSFILFSIAILWNPELGIICYISLISLYCFLDLQLGNIKEISKHWFLHIATAIIIMFASFLGYELIIRLFYGHFPDLFKMFTTIQIFSSIGMGMLPMPTGFHPYMLIVAVYLVGLLLTINAIVTKKITNRSAFICLLTIFGILFFVYYLGRSHNWNLFVSNPTAFILLTLFADDLLKTIKTNKAFIPLFLIVLYALSFSFFQTVYDYKRISDLILEKDNKQINQDVNNEVKANASFIKEHSTNDEKVIILTAVYLQSLYHSLSNTASAFNPGMEELFLKSDYARLIHTLETQENLKVFLEPKYFHFIDLQVLNRLTACYDLKQNNGKIFYFEKKKEKRNAKPLLTVNDKEVYHQLFNSTISTMLQAALGKNGKLQLGKQFTVEVLVKPNTIPQNGYTQSATIFSNISAQKGMILRQNDTIQNQYIFGFSNRGIICKTEMGKWNYLVFMVDDKKINCYVNGVLFGIVDTEAPYENSNEPLYIGSQNLSPGFFFGNLKEVTIANGLIDPKTIVSSWKNIQESLSKE